MRDFKIGDKVECLNFDLGHYGQSGSVISIDEDGNLCVRYNDGYVTTNYARNFELINRTNNNKTMNIKEKFVLSFLKEPNKTYRKLGITNGDDLLTVEGSEIYKNWRFQQDQHKFYDEVAKLMLEEQEKNGKK